MNEFVFKQVPIMVRSSFCHLYEKTDRDLVLLGECAYDQVTKKKNN